MPNTIKPPAPILGSPFTKLLKVALSDTGRIVVSGYAIVDGNWTRVHAPQEGLLANGSLSFDMGVPNGDRALLNVDADTWIDDWWASSQQLVGRHPDNNEFVFGEANFSGGDPNKFTGPGVINHVKKIGGKRALEIETRAATDEGGGLKPIPGRVTITEVNNRTSTVALVLWLEANKRGYIRFKNLPGLDRAVHLEL